MLVNLRGREYLPLGQMQEMFFYVPKGTRVLQYFWRGGPHKFLGPDRTVIREIGVSDEVISVDVPPGLDGRCWSLSPRAAATMVLQSQCRIAWPPPRRRCSLPREVVERDGLGTEE